MDVLTLIIAALGLCLAALSLGWQLASYVLEGRRVRVTLLHGSAGPGGFAVGPVGPKNAPNNLNDLIAEGFTTREVLGVRATNIGRVPATVSRYSVALSRGGFAFTPIGDAMGPDLPYRLEPGESATWYADMQDARALVTASRAVASVSRSVRMTVELGTGDKITTKRRLDVGSTDDQSDRRS
jgi:hypothetical protein